MHVGPRVVTNTSTSTNTVTATVTIAAGVRDATAGGEAASQRGTSARGGLGLGYRRIVELSVCIASGGGGLIELIVLIGLIGLIGLI